MRNKAARRQRPYACRRNALTTTLTIKMRSAFSSNASLASSLLHATEHHVTSAIASTADANFEPTKWVRKPPAKGEAQQLGFIVCSPVPCPQSGHQNKTKKRSTQQILTKRAPVLFQDERKTTRSRTCTLQAHDFILRTMLFYIESHAQCSCPRHVASTCI